MPSRPAAARAAALALTLAATLAAAGCAATAPSADRPPEGASPTDRVAPSDALGPRQFSVEHGGRPKRVLRILERWLDSLGDRAERAGSEGTAHLRRLGSPDARDDDNDDDNASSLLLRWRRKGGDIEFQCTSPGGLDGEDGRRAMASLAFAMEMRGYPCTWGPPSGCSPPEPEPESETVPPGAVPRREAEVAAFADRGLVLLEDEGMQDANIARFGPPGGKPEWRVDTIFGGGWTSFELFHEAVPFDAEGEHRMLVKILRRMGLDPWHLQVGHVPTDEEEDAAPAAAAESGRRKRR